MHPKNFWFKDTSASEILPRGRLSVPPSPIQRQLHFCIPPPAVLPPSAVASLALTQTDFSSPLLLWRLQEGRPLHHEHVSKRLQPLQNRTVSKYLSDKQASLGFFGPLLSCLPSTHSFLSIHHNRTTTTSDSAITIDVASYDDHDKLPPPSATATVLCVKMWPWPRGTDLQGFFAAVKSRYPKINNLKLVFDESANGDASALRRDAWCSTG